MRIPVASLTKKFISTFFAATLAFGLVPSAAFAAPDSLQPVPGGSEGDVPIASSAEGDDTDAFSHYPSEETLSAGGDVAAASPEDGSDNEPSLESVANEEAAPMIPAAAERVNEDVPLTQPVAQQESTRSYFLAQTLESVRTVPIVSANLPLDKGTTGEVTDPVEGDGADSSEDEGDEGSDESDPASDVIAAESTVVGSFEYRGITYAVEPGGETVAVMAADYAKLPEDFVEAKAIVLPSMVSVDGIDYYSVTRMADHAFSSLNSNEAGIDAITVPASITEVGDDVFTGFDTLQYIIVSDENQNYSQYDGCLYDAGQTRLLLVPEGRSGAVRIAPSVTEVVPEVFSHCPSVDTLVTDPDSAAYQLLEGMEDTGKGLRAELDGSTDVFTYTDLGYFEPGEAAFASIRAYFGDAATGEDAILILSVHDASVYSEVLARKGSSFLVAAVEDGDMDRLDIVKESRATSNALHAGTSYASYDSLPQWVKDNVKITNTSSLKSLTLFESKYYDEDCTVDWKNGGYGGAKGYFIYSQGKYSMIDTGYTEIRRGSRYSCNPSSDQGGYPGNHTGVGSDTWYNLEYTTDHGFQTRTKTGAWNNEVRTVCFVETPNTQTGVAGFCPAVLKLEYSKATSPAGSVYAKAVQLAFLPPQATIKWESNGGSTVSDWSSSLGYALSQSPDYTGSLPDPTPPNENYKLEGWYTTSNFASGTKISGSTIISGDVTLYAKWVLSRWSVTIDADGGTIYENNKSTGTSVLTWDAEPTSDATAAFGPSSSYQFHSYRVGAAASGQLSVFRAEKLGYTQNSWHCSGIGYLNDWSDPSAVLRPVGSGYTFTAGWKVNVYSISVYCPVKTSHAFHRYSDGNFQDSTGMASVDGYAFKTNEYNILTIQGTQPNAQKIRLVKRTSPLLEHYHLTYTSTEVGKYVNDAFFWDANLTQPAAPGNYYQNATLYLGWGYTDYTIGFSANGGTGAHAGTSKLRIDGTIVLPTTDESGIKRTGYALSGWKVGSSTYAPGATVKVKDLAAAAGCKANKLVDAITLDAQWTINTYSVSVYCDIKTTHALHRYLDGGFVDATGQTSVNGFAPSATQCNRFIVYGTTPINHQYIDLIKDAAPIDEQYHLIYHSDEVGKYVTGQFYWDDGLMNPVSGGSGRVYYQDATLYLGWDWTNYTVVYSANGGDGHHPNSPGLRVDGSLTLPAENNCGMTNPGYRLTGWKAGSTIFKTGESVKVCDLATAAGVQADRAADSLTLEAQWSANEYDITFEANGGSGGQSESMRAGFDSDMPTLKGNWKPVRAGYEFAGWWDSKAGGKQYYTAEGASARKWDKTKGATLYARWTKGAVHAISLVDELSGQDTSIWYWPERGYVATDADDAVVVEKGGEIVDSLSFDDYEFLGWFDENGNERIDKDGNLKTEEAATEPVTWYAQWVRLACTVTLLASYGEPEFEVDDEGTCFIGHVVFNKPFNANNGGKMDIPVRRGYTFMGYWTAMNPDMPRSVVRDDYAGECWIDGDGILSDRIWEEPADLADKASVTLYAAWQLDDCTVIFDTSTPAGTEIVRGDVDGQVWNYGKPLPEELPTPSVSTFWRNGYSFQGWYYEETNEDGDTVERFVCGPDGSRAFEIWDRDLETVTLHAEWKANEYTLVFDEAYPQIEGEDPVESPTYEKTFLYDTPFTVDDPTYEPYTFQGWYLKAQPDVMLAGAEGADGVHTTNGRFTPQGDLASQSRIEVKAEWLAPGESYYHLYAWTPGADDPDIQKSTNTYLYGDTVTFGFSSYPTAPDGWKPAGWVEVRPAEDEDGDVLARALIEDGGPASDAVVTSSFGPRANIEKFFVLKWTKLPLSLTFKTEPGSEADDSYVRATDILENAPTEDEGAPLAWSAVCDATNTGNAAHATYLAYDVTTPAFTLPTVNRRGYDFKGWKQVSPEEPLATDPIDPKAIAADPALQELVFAPVFEESVYTVVLDPGADGREPKTFHVKYNDVFEFPYPDALDTGACFSSWASAVDESVSSTKTFAPAQMVPVAQQQDGSLCLSDLDDDGDKRITLYAVWNRAYNAVVPISVATMAVDTETGDVVAATSVLEAKYEGDVYEVVSLRAEPVLDETVADASKRAPFSGADEGRVHLSVYAGLAEPADETRLLYKANVGANGALRYTDKTNTLRTASPLLLKLGDDAVSFVGKTASEGKPSLDAVTDASAGYGFRTFTYANPLVIRYGLVFDGVDPKAFDYDATGAKWTLPEMDAGNTDLADGKQLAWSSQSKPLAKLTYTVRLVNDAK